MLQSQTKPSKRSVSSHTNYSLCLYPACTHIHNAWNWSLISPGAKCMLAEPHNHIQPSHALLRACHQPILLAPPSRGFAGTFAVTLGRFARLPTKVVAQLSGCGNNGQGGGCKSAQQKCMPECLLNCLGGCTWGCVWGAVSHSLANVPARL